MQLLFDVGETFFRELNNSEKEYKDCRWEN